MMWFYLDDERGVPAGMDAVLVPDFWSMIRLISMCNSYHVEFGIDFDHDLGDDYLSGYGIAKYLVENQIPMAGFRIHSMNPVGAENIRQLLTHYGYDEIH